MSIGDDNIVACSCEAPASSSEEYSDTLESLDARLIAEAHARLQRRMEQGTLTESKELAFPYCSVFAPCGMFPISTPPLPLFMKDDDVVSKIRARLLKERQDAVAVEDAMEKAELAVLEAKCMLLESMP
ncbi:hypothetical protein C3747_21g890c [Trypanosoma cruzi]|uniref:Uncharacterized protein n=2 Tax=Trypanosoma cruzi TaxID=5693 RepID=Q4DK69_TRYCC|nr:hypothetical protein, conserved [Trypanosoma cruzi]EAN92935.1 hypothetical protein, conserved [Trypanosoma cruzi]PWV16910.1 hypothetical protein C3747_21g890c [Trypanosoma cruzi]|eukprot:XP_814786.1 hypothetical protein [Trypanosoma cruzi strain CL Brener]